MCILQSLWVYLSSVAKYKPRVVSIINLLEPKYVDKIGHCTTTDLLDPSLRRLHGEQGDHGGRAVVVVERLDLPKSSLDDRSSRPVEAVNEKFSSEKLKMVDWCC